MCMGISLMKQFSNSDHQLGALNSLSSDTIHRELALDQQIRSSVQ